MVNVETFPHRVCLIVFVALIIQICSANIDRDILLTPNRTDSLPSYKIQHYDPSESSLQDISGENVVTHAPWEEALKYTAYLALAQNTVNAIQRGNKDKLPPKSDTMRLPDSESSDDDKAMNDALKRAPLVGYDTANLPRFGDIILLARGRLEKSPIGQYRFLQTIDGPFCIESECIRQMPQNVTALWSVHRIRHRDSERKHRYELRFSIVPLGESTSDVKRDARAFIRDSHTRNFILRDEEYPHLFTTIPNGGNVVYTTDPPMRRYDRVTPSISRTIFDLMPFFRRPVVHHQPSFYNFPYNTFTTYKSVRPSYELNHGEYLVGGPVDKPMKSVYIKRPSTFSPNYIFTSPKNPDYYFKPFVPDFMKLPDKEYSATEPPKQIIRPQLSKHHYQPTHLPPHQDTSPTTIKPNFVNFPYNYVYTEGLKTKRPIYKPSYTSEKNSLLDYMKYTKHHGVIDHTAAADYGDYVKTNIPFTTKYSSEGGKYHVPETTTFASGHILQDALSFPSAAFATFPNTPYAIPIQVQLVTPPGFQYVPSEYPSPVRYMASSLQIQNHNQQPTPSATPLPPSAQSDPEPESSPSAASAPSAPSDLHSFTPYVPKRSSTTPNTIHPEYKKFRSSSKYERNRYSELDPLYHADYFTTLMPFKRPVEVTTIRQSLPVRHYPTHSPTQNPSTSSSAPIPSTVSPSLSSIYHSITSPSSINSFSSTSSLSTQQESQSYRSTARSLFQPIVAEEVQQPDNANTVNEVLPERKIGEFLSTSRPELFYQDSISAQLPAPENGHEFKITYVETSPEPQKTTSTTTPVLITPTKRNSEDRQKYPITTNRPTQTLPQTTSSSVSSSTTPMGTLKPRGSHRSRLYLPRTTEKPVLKWMPKQRRPRPSYTSTTTAANSVTQNTTPRSIHRRVHPVRTTSTSTTTSSSTTTTPLPPPSLVGPTALDDVSLSSEETKHQTEKVVTVTPSTINDIEEPTVQTRQSFSTSISFELGDRIPHSLPNAVVTDTSAPELANEIPHPEPVIETTTQQIEMVRAELQEIPTNVTNIALFTAEEEPTSSAAPTASEQSNSLAQLARSIVDHAKRITAENDLQTTTVSD